MFKETPGIGCLPPMGNAPALVDAAEVVGAANMVDVLATGGIHVEDDDEEVEGSALAKIVPALVYEVEEAWDVCWVPRCPVMSNSTSSHSQSAFCHGKLKMLTYEKCILPCAWDLC